MSLKIEFGKDCKTQSDYSDGALTIYATDIDSAFQLGLDFAEMRSNGKEAVYGRDNGRVFIRIPMTNRVT